jgi:predicted regulator of Ras-like GTPase activity (Roadblock/LC7/MglB family)
MNATEALAELRELSTQITVAALASTDGEIEASTIEGQASVKLARLAADIVGQADGVRRDMGREALAQLQVATPEGSLFIVLDGSRMAVATTGPDPTVGLVFYDLKTLLRQLGRDGGDDGPAAGSEPVADDAGEAPDA